MRWLPGIDVTISQPDLIDGLGDRCSRPGLTTLDAMRLSRRVGKDFLRSPFFDAERFLVYYERHDCPRLNRFHLVPRDDLVAFLDDRIRPECMQGVDLIITTFEMAEFLLTSHDGDLFYRRPSEWPTTDQGRA